MEGNTYYKFSQAFQHLMAGRGQSSAIGDGVVLRIKMEQNDEVCFEAKVGGKEFCLCSLCYNKEDGTLQNVAHNSSCQLNHTVSWVKRRRVVCWPLVCCLLQTALLCWPLCRGLLLPSFLALCFLQVAPWKRPPTGLHNGDWGSHQNIGFCKTAH